MDTIIYKKAVDISEFEELTILLKKNNISYFIEETKDIGDQLQINTNSGFNCFLRIRNEDKIKVDEIVLNDISINLNEVSEEYFLFSLENKELIEILLYPNEWSQYDFKLAEAILKSRGIGTDNISEDIVKEISYRREFEKEPSSKIWMWVGYLFALLGGWLGLAIGLIMRYSKRKLSDGTKIYDFEENDRVHGKIMIVLSIVMVIFWIFFWQIIKVKLSKI